VSATSLRLDTLDLSESARDLAAARARTSKTMAVSAIAHALLLLWLALLKPAAGSGPALTEIVLLDPSDLMPAASAAGAPAPAAREVKGLAVAHTEEERFIRSDPLGTLEPSPQSAAAEDRIAARLASLQQAERVPVRSVAVTGTPSGVLGAPAGARGPLGGAGGGMSLNRGGGTGQGVALPLTRGGSGTGTGPAVVATGLPAEPSAAGAPARGSESTTRRDLAGATLMGPVADRRVVQSITPIYPEWAKRDAVEGSVTLYFVVRPDGSIQENVLVQKTAGFEDFDDNARAALKAWRFEPLRGGRTGEQWGTITFRFRLREVSRS
jgi:TonB family protein